MRQRHSIPRLHGDVYYFGKRWDAPAYDGAIPAPVPTGDVCLYCEEPIAADDSGTWVAYLGTMGPSRRAVHIECQVRSALGDVEHLEGRCCCHGGTGHDERPYREQARAVVAWVERNR